jgi:hypothetical protein
MTDRIVRDKAVPDRLAGSRVTRSAMMSETRKQSYGSEAFPSGATSGIGQA